MQTTSQEVRFFGVRFHGSAFSFYMCDNWILLSRMLRCRSASYSTSEEKTARGWPSGPHAGRLNNADRRLEVGVTGYFQPRYQEHTHRSMREMRARLEFFRELAVQMMTVKLDFRRSYWKVKGFRRLVEEHVLRRHESKHVFGISRH